MAFPIASDAAAESFPAKIWEFRPVPEAESGRLAESCGLSPLAARVLAAREILEPDAAQAFLNPTLASLHDPFGMRDMDRAVQRIARALAERERIAVYGDYDADGLTATALLVRCFEWLGVEALPYIPHRLNEGYGMSRRGVEHLAALGVRLIVTVDNGISGLDEIAYAASHGIDVVVTDHHQPGVRLPDAAAVVDPNRADCPYPFKGLSGVGVAFKLAHALARELGKPAEESRAFLRSLMDLVALGTVTDIVPLVGENRILVAHGLKVLAATERVGLQALIQGLGFSGKAISGDTVGFLIGPRLNAAGRTEDARYGLELLLTRDDKEARRLADYLDELNQQRRRLENVAFEEALRMIESEAAWLGQRLLVAAGEGWHPGVLGIVASRLVDRFHRPSVVLSIEGDHAKGSARSTGHFNIHEALHACEALLSSYGGHKMAAGLTLTKKNVGPLREALNAVASRMMTEADLVPRLVVDTAARIDEMTLEALEQINRMRPFGEGNPSPVVALMGCRLAEPPQMKKGKHLKLRLAQPGGEGARQALSICAMGFGAGSRYNKVLRSGEPFDLAGAPTVNEWNGNRTVELTIRDIRPAATH